MEYYDILIAAEGIVGAAVMYGVSLGEQRIKTPKLRAVRCLPVVLLLYLAALSGFERAMLGAYAGILLLLWGFFKPDVKAAAITGIAAAVLCLTAFPLCAADPDYKSTDYLRDFEKGFESMKKHYVLTEHKGIDWDGLYAKYSPAFKEAADNHDKIANNIAWSRFTAEFNDGHVNFTPSGIKSEEEYEEYISELYERAGASDYGLSVMALSDGTFAAVNVDESLYGQGIKNGTRITLWDGISPLEAGENSPIMELNGFSDISNEHFMAPVFASATGGDSVRVTFIDVDGTEKEAVLPRLKKGIARQRETMETVDKGLEAGHMSWTQITDKTVCLRIKIMFFDSVSSRKNDYLDMKNGIKEQIAKFRGEGAENLIIDLRSNSGGSGMLVKTLGEIFAPEGEHYYCTDGLWSDSLGGYVIENGVYGRGEEHFFTGEGCWQGRIIILVNRNSVSAADHMAKIMQGMDNVTVMGLTKPNGSAQGVAEAGGMKSGSLSFSGSLVLDRDGSVFIDSGTDRISGDDVDILVPFDGRAVQTIFEEKKDYVLLCALEYLGDGGDIRVNSE